MSLFVYTKAFFKAITYPFLNRKLQLKIQEKNLKEVLSYARNYSDYYSSRIGEDLDLNKIEPINKIDFIKNFNEIVTDKNIKFENVKNGLIESNNENIRLNDKYSVAYTSGSTGNPTVIIEDENFQNVVSVTNFFRNLHACFPIIMLGESGTTGIESSMVKQNMKKTNLTKNVHFVDVSDSLDKIVNNLNNIGPATLIGYTGIMRILSNKLLNENIQIREKRIFLSAEKVYPGDKELISKAFPSADIRIMYGCTEAGLIACECKYGHLHIAEDCVKIEPVDENNNPVGYNKLSDKLLLTNLMNKVQPIIRYEVTDRIVLHNEKCPCGCKDDWLEIEGRSNDDIVLNNGFEDITIPSMGVLIKVADINKNGFINFKNYQIAIINKNKLNIKLDYYDGVDRKRINENLEKSLTEYFKQYNVDNVEYEFEEGIPVKVNRGKYRRIYSV